MARVVRWAPPPVGFNAGSNPADYQHFFPFLSTLWKICFSLPFNTLNIFFSSLLISNNDWYCYFVFFDGNIIFFPSTLLIQTKIFCTAPYTTLCIQFLDRVNNDKNNTLLFTLCGNFTNIRKRRRVFPAKGQAWNNSRKQESFKRLQVQTRVENYFSF